MNELDMTSFVSDATSPGIDFLFAFVVEITRREQNRRTVRPPRNDSFYYFSLLSGIKWVSIRYRVSPRSGFSRLGHRQRMADGTKAVWVAGQEVGDEGRENRAVTRPSR